MIAWALVSVIVVCAIALLVIRRRRRARTMMELGLAFRERAYGSHRAEGDVVSIAGLPCLYVDPIEDARRAAVSNLLSKIVASHDRVATRELDHVQDVLQSYGLPPLQDTAGSREPADTTARALRDHLHAGDQEGGPRSAAPGAGDLFGVFESFAPTAAPGSFTPFHGEGLAGLAAVQPPRRDLEMSKFLRAIELGMELLADLDALLLGQKTSFTFTWHGRSFTVTINPTTT